MKIEHNSQLEFYRSPFGAVTSGTTVTLRLALTGFGIPSYIRVVYEMENSIKYVNMYYVFDAAGSCVYEADLEIPDKCGLLWYYFDIAAHNCRIYYGNNSEGFGGMGMEYENIPDKKFQITVYDKEFKTPDWWKESVCYQIFPDRFAKIGDEFLSDRQDIIRRNWGDTPFYKQEQFGGEYLSNDFFGGNLQGIESKLSYLSELGISCIYLNPIFKAYSNHRYDTGDYKTIDPMLGTEADFTRLCESAEKLGIRVILDGVFNHVGSDSIYFNKKGSYDSTGAYQSTDSPYYEWFRFSNYPNEYESWWGIDTLPQTEEASESYQNYILTDKDSVVKRWLKKGASGWRLDVVDELPDFFVKILRTEVKKQNPDAVIIGEVWEDASNKVAYDEQRRYFMGAELDGVMNYPLRSAMIAYVKGDIDGEGFHKRIMSLKENYPEPAFYSSLNFLSGHDVERIMTVLGGKNYDSRDEKAGVRLDGEERETALKRLNMIIAMQMLLPGVPTVYYGDEAGMEGYADPFCRGCFIWGNENGSIAEYYKKNIHLRNSSDCFKRGSFETIYKVGGGYGFVRSHGDESYLVLVNAGDDETFRLDAARLGINKISGVFHDEIYSSEDGIYYINMPHGAVKIFKN